MKRPTDLAWTLAAIVLGALMLLGPIAFVAYMVVTRGPLPSLG